MIFYAKTHEWVTIKDDIATIGISDHAQAELGDIVFVEPPELETNVSPEEQMMVVESVKAASDIYAPIAGQIIAFNETLEDDPELVNQDPTGSGWLAKIKVDANVATDHLLDEQSYLKSIS